MKEKKISKTYTLSESRIQYIESYAAEHSLSKTAALEQIIDEHRSGCGTDVADLTAAAVVQKLDEKMGNVFTRIRLASTMADRNIEVLLEIMNTLLFKLNVSGTVLTSQSKHFVLQESEREIKRRVDELKQRKDNK